MASSITDFMKDVVYPRIDAVQAGLLDHLNPSGTMSSAGTYLMECPSCGKRKAYHYKGSSHINCARKNQCGESTSIWDALESNGLTGADVVEALCRAANVEPPKDERDAKHKTAQAKNSPTPISPGKAIIQVTQHLATKNPTLLNALQEARSLTTDQMKTMRLGVYTTAQEVLSLLESIGVTRDVAVEKGYVEVDAEDPSRLLQGMSGRVVGYWPHPDGDVRLWGRLANGDGAHGAPKYRFAPTLKKNTPYLFNLRKQSILVGVEGAFDAWALQLCGIWGCAVGQASVNAAQAQFFAEKGVTEYAQMLDGDKAGFDSGITTIKNCEAAGITTSIIPLGKGMDDADALRQAGKTDLLKGLVDSRMNAGEYLARMCTAYLNEKPANVRAFNRAIATARTLTQASRAIWLHYATALGYQCDPEHEAAQVFSNLIQNGWSVTDAQMTVARKTGFQILITEKELQHG